RERWKMSRKNSAILRGLDRQLNALASIAEQTRLNPAYYTVHFNSESIAESPRARWHVSNNYRKKSCFGRMSKVHSLRDGAHPHPRGPHQSEGSRSGPRASRCREGGAEESRQV